MLNKGCDCLGQIVPGVILNMSLIMLDKNKKYFVNIPYSPKKVNLDIWMLNCYFQAGSLKLCSISTYFHVPGLQVNCM